MGIMTTNENTENAEYFMKAMKKGSEGQAELLRRMASMQFDAMQGFMGVLQSITHYNAVFKATVQSNGRITIPEAEREALGIEDGDLVQVVIVPMEKGKKERGGSKDE
ncbi:MAG: AbrB/MazE/SpoVT family DNA-binding domain-containing protein [Nitrososphaerales archaeon]